MSASELEDALLDVDGRVSRELRHHAPSGTSALHIGFAGVSSGTAAATHRAAKALTIWRWPDASTAGHFGVDREQFDQEQFDREYRERGGRVCVGSVFYLRRA